MRAKPNLISVTPLAASKIKEMITNRNKDTVGIRLGIRTKGCSGMSYILEYSDCQNDNDQAVELHDITFLIDFKSLLFIIGTVIDYKEGEFDSGFSFANPSEKGRCGCGESFHV